jgi:hypothetical protein
VVLRQAKRPTISSPTSNRRCTTRIIEATGQLKAVVAALVSNHEAGDAAGSGGVIHQSFITLFGSILIT